MALVSFISRIKRTLVGGKKDDHWQGSQIGFTDYSNNISCSLEEIRHLAKGLAHDRQSTVAILATVQPAQ